MPALPKKTAKKRGWQFFMFRLSQQKSKLTQNSSSFSHKTPASTPNHPLGSLFFCWIPCLPIRDPESNQTGTPGAPDAVGTSMDRMAKRRKTIDGDSIEKNMRNT